MRNFEKEKEEATRELQNISRIESEFKMLGKAVYRCWLDDEPMDIMNTIIEAAHIQITKLNAEIKNKN